MFSSIWDNNKTKLYRTIQTISTELFVIALWTQMQQETKVFAGLAGEGSTGSTHKKRRETHKETQRLSGVQDLQETHRLGRAQQWGQSSSIFHRPTSLNVSKPPSTHQQSQENFEFEGLTRDARQQRRPRQVCETLFASSSLDSQSARFGTPIEVSGNGGASEVVSPTMPIVQTPENSVVCPFRKWCPDCLCGSKIWCAAQLSTYSPSFSVKIIYQYQFGTVEHATRTVHVCIAICNPYMHLRCSFKVGEKPVHIWTVVVLQPEWSCDHHVTKDTVDSAPFHSGAGCYGRDGEDCQDDHSIAQSDHDYSLQETSLGGGQGGRGGRRDGEGERVQEASHITLESYGNVSE